MSYEMIYNYTHFLKTGNWKWYLEVLFEFFSYCFRLNCPNYALNLSYCHFNMRVLEEENMSANKYLDQGGFSG